MLSQIESAFRERTESNTRLRRFIADASHELRTPLTSIRGYSEMLRRGAAESPADADTARRRIEEESVRMSVLVDDMLLIARLDQGRPLERKPVDLQAIASDAAADARAVAPHREITVSGSWPGGSSRATTRDCARSLETWSATPLSTRRSRARSRSRSRTVDGVGRMSVIDHGPGLKPGRARAHFSSRSTAPTRAAAATSGGAGLVSRSSAPLSARTGET